MFTARRSRVARHMARVRRFLAELDEAQRRMTEIKTGLPYVARERHSSSTVQGAPAGLYTDQVD
ncbi:MAG: hypothetical protein JO321_11860 [Solirubrobacterales bacterium]|nr:hypothetical protein [Solirubrobacterales bacterium]MBV9168289.1 hypothetical protein [Solirubrobacterales bacterium]MBV9536095.1 hypothetical protein [Solirubrobacterales bacterium]